MAKRFDGVVGRTFEDSQAWWPPVERAPDGAPNVVIVLLDDVGYAQFGCYGSDIATPTFDRLAAEGLRYANFHTTALCSPTRACLLTGRNHHSVGMGRIVEFSSGFPGYDTNIPPEHGYLSQILLGAHYATYAVGKWHLTPGHEMAMGAPRDHWPLRKGFERFYGFLAGETDQYHPELIHDNHQVPPPRTPEEGYHLTEDLVDRAVGYLKDLRAYDPVKPFFLWFTPGACHAPHQVPAPYAERYRGRFDRGWDAWRDDVFARQVAGGLLPAGTELSPRPAWVRPWDALSDDERRLYARMMEVYAGFLTHTDEQVGRLLGFIESLGELDNTLVLLMSDNGASAEGGAGGMFNEQYFFNFVPEQLEENLRRIDDLGTPRASNHYPWGWAWAGNTPFKRFKRDTHEGGVCDPLIVHWPARLGRPGETRHQYAHAIDILPTVLELVGVEAPTHLDGIEQAPFEGFSLAASMTAPTGPSPHTTQYYEMLGSRAIYHDGWKAVVYHPPAAIVYDGSDARRSFDDDVWELYHVAEDFSECHDVAAQHPDKLAELQQLWWREAERHRALPLNNQPGRFGDRRFVRDRYVFHPGMSSLPEAVAPNLRGRPYQILAALDVPADGPVDGVLACHGGHTGGYALYVQDRRLRFVHNLVGTTFHRVAAEVELPAGSVLARLTFTPTGRTAGDIELWYDDVPVGGGHLPSLTPVTYGTEPFCVGAQPGTPICEELVGRAEPPAGVLQHVVIEVAGTAARDAAAEERVAMSRQ
ncbi:MAG: arylsulfatase [Acidimicrobiia bacterium]